MKVSYFALSFLYSVVEKLYHHYIRLITTEFHTKYRCSSVPLPLVELKLHKNIVSQIKAQISVSAKQGGGQMALCSM